MCKKMTTEDDLYVVCAIFNSRQYKSRIKHYNDFAKYIKDSGATLITVEIAFGARPHEVTHPNNPHHIQLRTSQEIWHKERALNIAIQHLPYDWNYCCWIDPDIKFSRPDWVSATIDLLQHRPIIQMFSNAHDLTADHEIYKTHVGIIKSYLDGTFIPSDQYSKTGHPGFSWGFTRDAINNLGGLIDIGILGSSDRHMAMSLLGCGELSYHKDISDNYKKYVKIYQDRCDQYIKRNVGYLQTELFHCYHGNKLNRKYHERWKLLVELGFDPELDLKPDWQGLWQLTDRVPALRTAMMRYFYSRKEDECIM